MLQLLKGLCYGFSGEASAPIPSGIAHQREEDIRFLGLPLSVAACTRPAHLSLHVAPHTEQNHMLPKVFSSPRFFVPQEPNLAQVVATVRIHFVEGLLEIYRRKIALATQCRHWKFPMQRTQLSIIVHPCCLLETGYRLPTRGLNISRDLQSISE